MRVYSFIESGLGEFIALRVTGGWKLYEHECVDPVLILVGMGFRYLTLVLSLEKGGDYLYKEFGVFGYWLELDPILRRRVSGLAYV